MKFQGLISIQAAVIILVKRQICMCQYIKTSLKVTLNLDRERLKIIIKEVFLRHKRPL